MITQTKGNFNSPPAMTSKRTELKAGKYFSNTGNSSTVIQPSAPSPGAAPPTHSTTSRRPLPKPKRQRLSTKLPFATKPHFLQHCRKTHSPWPCTRYTGAGAQKSALPWNQSPQAEPSPGYLHPHRAATLPLPPPARGGFSRRFQGMLYFCKHLSGRKSYRHHLLLPLWNLPVPVNATGKVVPANSTH